MNDDKVNVHIRKDREEIKNKSHVKAREAQFARVPACPALSYTQNVKN